MKVRHKRFFREIEKLENLVYRRLKKLLKGKPRLFIEMHEEDWNSLFDLSTDNPEGIRGATYIRTSNGCLYVRPINESQIENDMLDKIINVVGGWHPLVIDTRKKRKKQRKK